MREESHIVRNGTYWRPMISGDLASVYRIASCVHTSMPEADEVLAEKWQRGGAACWILVEGDHVVGYCLAHRWVLGHLPKLDAKLGPAPDGVGCLYLHDVAVLPQARGQGAADVLMEILREEASRQELTAAAMVSVYGTARLWQRHGFQRWPGVVPTSSYGTEAVYLVNPNFALP